MAYCSNCGSEIDSNASVCPSCGAIIGEAPKVVNEWDHTSEFDAKDISDTKVYAICTYLLGFFGVLLGLLVKDSAYVKFHSREALKILVAEIVVCIVSSLLCWTCIIPVAGVVFECIFFVLRIIAIVQVCKGKAKEPWLIRSIKCLK